MTIFGSENELKDALASTNLMLRNLWDQHCSPKVEEKQEEETNDCDLEEFNQSEVYVEQADTVLRLQRNERMRSGKILGSKAAMLGLLELQQLLEQRKRQLFLTGVVRTCPEEVRTIKQEFM